MYDRLLLCKQGGIIDVSQMAEQDNSVHICIGLGGTGVDCLKNLKAKVYNRIRPDNPDSSVPQYSHIKFLAVDSDRRAFEYGEKSGFGDFCKLDPDNECFPIGQDSRLSDLFRDKEAIDSNPAYREWFDHKKIRVFKVDVGASGVPQIGRYLFACRAKAFLDGIIYLMEQARVGLINPQLYIHIFSGISGGTGAGIFLDVCYLVREAIRLSGITNGYICGYFFLPDVNIAKGVDNSTERFIKSNGFASLRELDYCMNFENNGDKWSQYYKDIGLIEYDCPPVQLCHIISASTATGDVLPDGYNYAMNIVTDYMLSFLAKCSGFMLDHHIDRCHHKPYMIEKEYGANYTYCTIAASSAYIPRKEMLTYLTAEVFEIMSDTVKDVVPTKNDCDAFINKNALSYDRIFAQLTYGADIQAFPLNDVKWRDALANDDLTVTYFTNMANRSSGKVDENFSALSREIENYDDTEALQDVARSLITKIFVALKDIACDNKYGPFYAARLLRSNTGVDLIAVVDGYLKEALGKFAQENAQEDKIYTEWKKAQDEFFSCNTNMFNGKRRYYVYVNATRLFFLHRVRMVAFNRMVDLMRLLLDQIIKLSTEFMDVLMNTVKQLIDTFDENKRYLDSSVIKHVSYEIPIVALNDVMPDLKRTISEMDIGQNITQVMRSLTSKEGIDAWIDSNEDDISAFINRYFTELFQDYSKKTMTSYLQNIFGVVAPAVLVAKIEQELMSNLIKKASPMFWSTSTYDVNGAANVGYITCPADSVEVSSAAENIDAKVISARKCDDNDRISVIKCCVGIPLFGYSDIYTYEKSSINSKFVGQYIYEGKCYKEDGREIIGRNWRLLPSPIPFRIMREEFSSPELMHLAEEAKDLYSEAEARGVIREYDSYDFGIFTISDAFMCSYRTAFEDGKNNENKDDRLQTQAHLELLSKNIEYNSPIPIPNDCTLSDVERKREFRIEHFVKSPCLQKIVRAELDKLKEINDAIHYFD